MQKITFSSEKHSFFEKKLKTLIVNHEKGCILNSGNQFLTAFGIYMIQKNQPSFLFDSKTDIVIYGLGKRKIVKIFDRIREGKTRNSIHTTSPFSEKNERANFMSERYTKIDPFEIIPFPVPKHQLKQT